jgi:Kef-type K+ transport system membrane component KefB
MEIHHTLLVLGGLLLLGLVADELGRRTRIPRITLLILLGFAIGPSGFDVLPKAFQDWYPFLATVALTMVAFLLGSNLSVDALRKHGREILSVSLTVVGVTVFVVALGLAVLGVSILLSFILAGIATATAPAASQDVVRQTGASGPFTDTLLGVVAIDDAWGLIVFSILLVIAKAIVGDGAMSILLHGLWEVGGAFLVGAAVGLPAAFLTGRLQEGEPIQAEALGIVFVCAGLAIWLGVSFLLAGIVAGIIVVNLAQHHNRAFHEIEHVEWPFMVLFFIVSGAMLHLDGLHAIGVVGMAYIVLRTASRVIGGWLGATLAGAPMMHRRWIGIALLPQAGVALGMALIAGHHLPDMKEMLLAIVIGSTVVFEIVGPVLTQLALYKVGEAR